MFNPQMRRIYNITTLNNTITLFFCNRLVNSILNITFHGVVVSTLDSASKDSSSNLGGTLLHFTWRTLSVAFSNQ